MSSSRLIMVVDDDDDIRNTLGEVLGLLSYDVILAADGQDALARLRSGVRPDVILLDLMMPVMNGFDVVTEMRKQPELAAIPILVITAAGNARVEAGKLATAGYIQKPFKMAELIAALARIFKS